MNLHKFIVMNLIAIVFIFSGCSKTPKPQIKYVYKTEYVYLPCKKEKLLPQSPLQSNKKAIKKQVKPHKKAKFYKPSKKLKTFAPKHYITRPNKKMDFMVGINKDGSKFIYMEGEFGVNTYKNFLHFIKTTANGIKEIKISSNGGVVASAMQIGAYIHDHKMNTGVDQEMHCYSACGFVFFAGRKKSLQGEAKVGLHRPYVPGVADTPRSIRQTKRQYISYWNYIKAPKSLYDEMMEVDRDELFILDKNNIEDYIDIDLE